MERQEGDKLVLYRGHQLFVMGTHAAEIWRLCDGKCTVQEMIEKVVDLYGVERARAEQEISSFILNLKEKRLINL